MFAEGSAYDLFRKFMGNETNCSTNQMARIPMNVNKKKDYKGMQRFYFQKLFWF